MYDRAESRSFQGTSSRANFIDPETYEIDEKYAVSIRHGFIRKVYGILLSQIALTTIIGGFLVTSIKAREWIVFNGGPIILVAAIAAVVTMLVLVCVPGLAQKHPTNMILLGLFTSLEAVSIGGICAMYAEQFGGVLILKALLVTLIVVAGLTLYAMQTSYDFTNWLSYMYVILLGLMGFGLLTLLFPKSDMLQTIYAAGGAIVFGIYLLIDTQLLVGKSTEMKVDEDQYILISLSLYMDIVNIFLNILKLMSKMENQSNGGGGGGQQ